MQLGSTILLFEEEPERVFGGLHRNAVVVALNAEAAIDLKPRAAVGQNQLDGTWPFPGLAPLQGVDVKTGSSVEQIFLPANYRQDRQRLQGLNHVIPVKWVLHHARVHFMGGRLPLPRSQAS